MVTEDELRNQVDKFFEGAYSVINGRAIPNVGDIQFGKTGTSIEVAMLFIDIRESTRIVDGFRRVTAAKMYKSFLWGVSKIVRMNSGELRGFNGDGVLIVFAGDRKCNQVVRAALQLSWFVANVLRPKMHACFGNNSRLDDLTFEFGVGVHAGTVLVS